MVATALVSGAGAAHSSGLDRSNQDITLLFEPGNYAEFSIGQVAPDLTGTDVLGNPIGDTGVDFTQLGAGVKLEVSPTLSFALIADQPFGADISYPGASTTTMLGGTEAFLESAAITALGRYRINDNVSVHAGLRYEQIEAEITLSGLGYGPLNGYNVMLDRSGALGYVVGGAYEIPEIALRVALTYNSSMTHEFDATETLNGIPIGLLPVSATGGLDGVGKTSSDTPEALNLDFQTGIAEDTLLFAAVRYARHSQTVLSPEFFSLATGGGSLTEIEDATSYSVGLGRRFNDVFSASVSVGYEAEGDDLVSPLAPTNGARWAALGAQYTMMGNVVLSTGVRYTLLGDAQPETGTPDTARASFADNSAVSVGASIGYRF